MLLVERRGAEGGERTSDELRARREADLVDEVRAKQLLGQVRAAFADDPGRVVRPQHVDHGVDVELVVFVGVGQSDERERRDERLAGASLRRRGTDDEDAVLRERVLGLRAGQIAAAGQHREPLVLGEQVALRPQGLGADQHQIAQRADGAQHGAIGRAAELVRGAVGPARTAVHAVHEVEPQPFGCARCVQLGDAGARIRCVDVD